MVMLGWDDGTTGVVAAKTHSKALVAVVIEVSEGSRGDCDTVMGEWNSTIESPVGL